METRHDYEYIRDNRLAGWEDCWLQLLEGRWIVTPHRIFEDPEAKIYRLGFTVPEVKDAIGHTGLTQTESDFLADHQDWYAEIDGHLVENPGYGEYLAALEQDEAHEKARAEKIAEINAAFQAAELLPVTIGGYAYRGGFQSGLAIDAQRRAMVEYAIANPRAGIVSVDFFDVTGAKVTLPLLSKTEIDALDVCIALHQSASANAFKCAQLVAALHAATTLSEVEAITW